MFRIVLILARGRLALGLEYPDYGKRDRLDPNDLPDRILSMEQIVDDGLAQQRYLSGAFDVRTRTCCVRPPPHSPPV